MTTAQINARIDSEAKMLGDAGLAAAGLSPSQAIRALWDLAGCNRNEPEAIIAALFPEQLQQSEAHRQTECERRARLIEEGPSIAHESYAAFGIEGAPPTASLSYDELKEQAAFERHGKAMGWNQP